MSRQLLDVLTTLGEGLGLSPLRIEDVSVSVLFDKLSGRVCGEGFVPIHAVADDFVVSESVVEKCYSEPDLQEMMFIHLFVQLTKGGVKFRAIRLVDICESEEGEIRTISRDGWTEYDPSYKGTWLYDFGADCKAVVDSVVEVHLTCEVAETLLPVPCERGSEELKTFVSELLGKKTPHYELLKDMFEEDDMPFIDIAHLKLTEYVTNYIVKCKGGLLSANDAVKALVDFNAKLNNSFSEDSDGNERDGDDCDVVHSCEHNCQCHRTHSTSV